MSATLPLRSDWLGSSAGKLQFQYNIVKHGPLETVFLSSHFQSIVESYAVRIVISEKNETYLPRDRLDRDAHRDRLPNNSPQKLLRRISETIEFSEGETEA